VVDVDEAGGHADEIAPARFCSNFPKNNSAA
jgi:hypothetical protein